MSDYLLYDLTLSVLTPLHIGNGQELLHEYDYAIQQGRTWRLNENALLDAQSTDDPDLTEKLARTRPAELLRPADYRPDNPLFRYVLKGTPRSSAEGAQLREQLKDPFDRVYIPGSSLKGAFRTALVWHAWEVRQMRADVGDLGTRRQWAGQRLEQQLLGRDPNNDALRVLQVGDSDTQTPADALMILNVRVHHRNGQLASPIELEAVRPNQIFRLRLKLDLALYSDWARRAGLQLPGRDWLQQLPHILQAHSRQRLERERAWFGAIRGAERVAAAYQQLLNAQPGPDACLVQLGWGTGWESKTLGGRLQANPPLMERIITDYKLARGKRQKGDPFPKSRRLAISLARDRQGNLQETPAAPLGWCLVEWQRKEHV